MTNDILGGIWPEWHIVKQIGRGAFGVVYEAVRTEHSVESRAAIKVISIPQNEAEVDSLRSEGLSREATRTYLQGVVNDFISEIRIMESFKGVQNIVSVEDYKVVEKTDEIGWDIYIRMELLTSFNSYICDKKLSEDEVIKLGVDICTALELCAQQNVIHRDIKPQNIFINQFGDFKLGDFGIARKLENVNGGLSQKGSPNYMAPEVAKSTQYDATVDLYSLGIVLYQLMNKNHLPLLDTENQLINPNEREAALNRRLDGEPIPPPCDASPNMAQVILCACSANPSRRFTSATAMKNALISVLNGTYHMSDVSDLDRTTSVRKAPVVSDQKSVQSVNTFGIETKKKNKLPFIITAVLAVLILVGAGVFVITKLVDGDGRGAHSETSAVSDYSKFDEEQIDSIISEAEALATEGDYEGALTKVKDGLITYPKSKVLQEKSEEYTNMLNAQVKETTLAEAAALAESGDYIAAMALIKNSQDTYGDDAEYQNAYMTYTDAYVTDAITQSDELVVQGNYDAAIALLENAETNVGKNDILTEKILEINNSKPVYEELTSLKVIDSSYYYSLYEGLILDTYGNAYTNVGTFRECGTHYAIYYTAGKYSTLYGTIAAPDSIGGESVAITVNIYADDKIIYTIPSITRTTKPVDISLDITGADTVKIEAITTNVYPTGILFKLNVSTGTAATIPNYISSLDYGEKENITDLKVVDSSYYYSVSDAAVMDSYGNTYAKAGIFRECGTHYAIYYTAGKYKTLSGTIAAPDSIGGESVAITVNIYADDKLIHTIPSITRTTKPVYISLDIDGAETVKIEAVTTNVYPTGILFRLDVL